MITDDPASGRPLVVRFGALGDVVMLTVLLRSLHTQWGRPCDLIASGGSPQLALQGLDCTGEVITIPSRRTPYPLAPDQRRLVRWLRARGPSPTWVVEDMAKVDWLLERGGVPRSCRVSLREVPRGDLEHAVDHHLRLGSVRPPRFAGHPLSPPPLGDAARQPRLAVSEAERADCRGWLGSLGWEGQPLVLFQSQSRRRKRGRWPDEKWRQTVGNVLDALPDAWALLLGAPNEESEIEALRQACGNLRVHTAARDLGLRRLFALATYAHSAISLDTGPAHVFAAFDCPVVVLVGMADPRRNAPIGPAGRVWILTSWPESRWPTTRAAWEATHQLADITVDAVVSAWEEVAAVGGVGRGLWGL